MSIILTSKGDWRKTFDFLHKASELSERSKKVLQRAAEEGVEALKENTPVKTGRLADSWGYTIEYGPESSVITWTNDDIEGGENVAILVQYGHGRKGGGYVSGRDMITPALSPIFDNFIETLWKEVIG